MALKPEVAYFDSSALVKLVVYEPGSDTADALWNDCAVATSSLLSYPEVRAAVAAVRRSGRISPAREAKAEREWEDQWSVIQPIELIDDLSRHAGHLAKLHSLRGADAVHLASALTIGEAGPLFACWDRRLSAAAQAEGLAVVPPT